MLASEKEKDQGSVSSETNTSKSSLLTYWFSLKHYLGSFSEASN